MALTHVYEDLQEQNSHLQEQVAALQDSLKRDKCQVACLTNELMKKQEMPHVPPKFTTKLSSVSLAPVASSSCATAGTEVPASINVSQPVPLLSRVTINLTKEEGCDDILNRHSITPNYGVDWDSEEKLLKGEALEWSCTLNSIPKGAKHQGKVQKLAHDEIKAELSELRKDYMARIVSHGINDPALKELEEAVWASYHLCWKDFGHALKQANAGVKFPKWLQ
jgi:hypothetical protein